MTSGRWNAPWARTFLDELAGQGVTALCVAPGSRSTPLVLAAARDSRFRMYSVIDERSAGFLALGIGKASGRPAGVITTSGTAGANLYPAVIEASQGEVPLLVLTADRPHRLRDTDGNQAMDQLRLFGVFPRAFFEVEPPRPDEPSLRHLRGLAARAVALALGPPAGPVHLNFPFEKPLEPAPEAAGAPDGQGGALLFSEAGSAARGHPPVHVAPTRRTLLASDVDRLLAALEEASRGLIVAGPVPNPDRVGSALLALGAATGFPVLADPLSGARFRSPPGARVVGGYDLFLRSPFARDVLSPDLVLRVGGSPTSGALLEFLDECRDARQIVVDDGLRWKDHLASADTYLKASPAPLLQELAARVGADPEPGWGDLWTEAERRTRQALEARGDGELLEGEILGAVVDALPEGATLFVGSSMPVRDLDAFGFPGHRTLRVFGNRGVSGIDGSVSTALGIALASEAPPGGRGAGEEITGRNAASGEDGPGIPPPRPTVAVLGDLAFFHDMNGLLALRELRPWLVVVVVNNDGGGIFHTLSVREHEPAFTRFFATPHGLDFRKAADLYDLPYALAGNLDDLEGSLSEALGRGTPGIVEIRTRREETHARRREVVSAVVAAMEGLDGTRGT